MLFTINKQLTHNVHIDTGSNITMSKMCVHAHTHTHTYTNTHTHTQTHTHTIQTNRDRVQYCLTKIFGELTNVLSLLLKEERVAEIRNKAD